jgi:hypothetical protein
MTGRQIFRKQLGEFFNPARFAMGVIVTLLAAWITHHWNSSLFFFEILGAWQLATLITCTFNGFHEWGKQPARGTDKLRTWTWDINESTWRDERGNQVTRDDIDREIFGNDE